MNDLTYIIVGIVFILGMAYFAVSIYLDLRKVRKKTVLVNAKNVSDHQVINQRIQLDERKFIDLEIRVKVLEDDK